VIIGSPPEADVIVSNFIEEQSKLLLQLLFHLNCLLTKQLLVSYEEAGTTEKMI
jgi:hypothetical protein